MPPQFYDILFATFSFILGAAIGSFLNVCIYRMPRDLSVNEPRRSFCPSCKYQIPWHRNLPLISWLSLRGKCANCGTKIPARYFVVELVTGLLFLGVWWRVGEISPTVLAYWIMVSLFVVATFIDLGHYIIPDQITIGGTLVGILCAMLFPSLMGVTAATGNILATIPAALIGGPAWYFFERRSRDSEYGARALQFTIGSILGVVLAWGILLVLNARGPQWSLERSVAGAVIGFGILWLVSAAGKIAFGRKRLTFDKPETITWTRHGERAELKTGDKVEPWDEFFPDEKAVMVLKCPRLEIAGNKYTDAEIRTRYTKLSIGNQSFDLNKVESFTGEVREVFFQRDAMGFGDVKFLACIGAFLGWPGAAFAVMAGSVTGAVIGIGSIAIGRREWSAKIPFGPYLAVGALVWFFTGPELVEWYFSMLQPTEVFGR